MAGGNNAAFIANTKEYIRTHQLMISPQGIGSQGLNAGLMDIDLVSIDPQNAQFIRLENYLMRPAKGKETTSVKAFYLARRQRQHLHAGNRSRRQLHLYRAT